MPSDPLKYCTTDKEIYDLLMSSRQRMNETSLHDMAKERGIFYSPKDSRDTLAGQLSLLPHDYDTLRELLGQSENPNRAEKVTSIKLNVQVSNDDIKEVMTAFKESESRVDEKVISHAEGPDKYLVQVQYSEIDYGRTRLLQRRKREADIRFIAEGGTTTIRMPANDRARELAAELKARLESQREAAIPTELIELSDLSADERTEFFTSLISEMDGYDLRNVTNVKVDSGSKESAEPDEDNEDDETAEAKEEMISVVENVALHGQSLLSSAEYQHLRQKGFYITSITWISKQTANPFNKVEFEAGFEEPKEGKEFRYNVRGIYRNRDGEYTKTRRQVTPEHKQAIFPIIESTAHKVLTELRKEHAAGSGEGAAK